MSALPPKADMCGATKKCSLCANSGHCAIQLDHLVGIQKIHPLSVLTCPAWNQNLDRGGLFMKSKLARRRLGLTALAPLHPPTYGVEIRPLLVATIRRLPHRKIDLILPTPGTVSPRVARQVPLGPSNTAVPFVTSRSVQPLMVVGLVSRTGANFTGACNSCALGPIDVGCCSASFRIRVRVEQRRQPSRGCLLISPHDWESEDHRPCWKRELEPKS